MYRNVINELVSWFEEKRRRILFIKGAHGVGKTWTVKDFATAYFPSQKYIDCAEYPAFANIIAGIKTEAEDTKGDIEDVDKDDSEDSSLLSKEELDDMSMGSRVLDMDFLLEEHFDNAKLSDSLLIFDNVQDIPDCASFFYEFSKSHKDYSICLIASTMELTEYEYSHQDVFNIIRMRPMTFEEYMIANKAHPFMNAIRNNKDKPLTSLEVNAISVMLKEYLLIGGMPGAVIAYLKNKELADVRPVQLQPRIYSL
ncbi:MAG: AAA family ATPase, partial [Lachnospiraceae bacterium]|nr:AAA family ATPase [Lachnospiraceae bacterium]